MNPTFLSVPFKTETHSGFRQVDGIGKFSSAGVVLEFESKFLGLIKGGVKEIRIAVEEILDVRFRKGFFKLGTKIEIRLKSLSRLSELPSEGGKLSLSIKRQDFDLAKEAVERIQKDMADLKASLPPKQTPVSSLFEDTEDLLDTKELE